MKCKKLIVIGIMALLIILSFKTICNATTAIVNTDTLKLRKEASTDSTVLELLNQGEKLDIIEESGDWYKVKAKGITGFVHKDYVKVDENTNTQNNVNKVSTNTNTQNIVNEQTPQNTIDSTSQGDNIINKNDNTQENKQFEIREETIQNNVDIYILPLINSNKISNIKSGTKIIVMDEIKNWMYIQTNEINGWICKNNLKTTTANTTTNNTTTNEIKETPIEEKVMYVNSPSVYVRSGPATSYKVVDSLILNTQVTITAESEDWYKVKIGDVTGYIAKRLLSETSQETTSRGAEERTEEKTNSEQQIVQTNITQTSKGEQIVEYAKQYLGCKYVYGGSGPNTFDCSGFTMYVYKNFGISLSHSATAQSKNGTYIAKEDLQLGDLVFFKDYETMNGIGHCGIYVGDGNFIHASSGTGYCVKISTLLSGSYNTRYETARRLI